MRHSIGHSIRPPPPTTTFFICILEILFGVFVFGFDKNKGFDYLENDFICENECGFSI